MPRGQIIAAYDDSHQLRDVNDLALEIERAELVYDRDAVVISHNNPSNSIYVHAVVIYR